jgi:hypothetical protein
MLALNHGLYYAHLHTLSDHEHGRWFVCGNDAEAKLGAHELVGLGLCNTLKTLSDLPPDPLSLLCLLTDAQLRALLGGRLGGNPKACTNRPALVQAIGEAARAKVHTPRVSTGAAAGTGTGTGTADASATSHGKHGHGKNKADRRLLTQTTLTGSTCAGRLPTALLEMLKTTTCVRLSDKTERTLHRCVLARDFLACDSHSQTNSLPSRCLE